MISVDDMTKTGGGVDQHEKSGRKSSASPDDPKEKSPLEERGGEEMELEEGEIVTPPRSAKSERDGVDESETPPRLALPRPASPNRHARRPINVAALKTEIVTHSTYIPPSEQKQWPTNESGGYHSSWLPPPKRRQSYGQSVVREIGEQPVRFFNLPSHMPHSHHRATPSLFTVPQRSEGLSPDSFFAQKPNTYSYSKEMVRQDMGASRHAQPVQDMFYSNNNDISYPPCTPRKRAESLPAGQYDDYSEVPYCYAQPPRKQVLTPSVFTMGQRTLKGCAGRVAGEQWWEKRGVTWDESCRQWVRDQRVITPSPYSQSNPLWERTSGMSAYGHSQPSPVGEQHVMTSPHSQSLPISDMPGYGYIQQPPEETNSPETYGYREKPDEQMDTCPDYSTQKPNTDSVSGYDTLSQHHPVDSYGEWPGQVNTPCTQLQSTYQKEQRAFSLPSQTPAKSCLTTVSPRPDPAALPAQQSLMKIGGREKPGAQHGLNEKNRGSVVEWLLARARHQVECTEQRADRENESRPSNQKGCDYNYTGDKTAALLPADEPGRPQQYTGRRPCGQRESPRSESESEASEEEEETVPARRLQQLPLESCCQHHEGMMAQRVEGERERETLKVQFGFDGFAGRGMENWSISAPASVPRTPGVLEPTWPQVTEILSDLHLHGRYLDSHCHLDFVYNKMPKEGKFETVAQLREKVPAAFPNAFKGMIANFVDPRLFVKEIGGEEYYDQKWMRTIIQSPEVVGASFGVHPHHSDKWNDGCRRFLANAIDRREESKIVAIGECGVDLSFKNRAALETQLSVFEEQVELASKHRLPLIVHCRSAKDTTVAEEKVLDMITRIDPSLAVHRHCFCEDVSIARRWMAALPNCVFGFTPGVWKFNSAKLRAIDAIPLDKMVLETDAPYFCPSAMLDIDSRLEYVSLPPMAVVAAFKISQVKRVSVEQVLRCCFANTCRIYGLEKGEDGEWRRRGQERSSE